MNPKLLLFLTILAVTILNARASQMYILDDGEYEHYRYRRDLAEAPLRRFVPGAGAPDAPPRGLEFNPIPPVGEDLYPAGSSSYHKGYGKPGKVGPVYTFVKTDPYHHVKWGVRHVAGKKYAGHH